MATPRVFISSTCYDLSEVRDGLKDFIQSLYLEPVLSEHGDVFYHPDLDTHESCLQEVQHCQLFVLIIGGRRGGDYVADPEKSIVNAEYTAAKSCGIPIFTFVKRDVLSEHRFYQTNKGKDMEFSSIVKKEDGPRIFSFIDEVRRAGTNNAFFAFDTGADIRELLGKQLAGLLYDFLRNREHREQMLTINTLLSSMRLANEKAEELIKKVYGAVDKQNAAEVISDLDRMEDAKRFFEWLRVALSHQGFLETPEELTQIDEELWWRFLVKTRSFTLHENIKFEGGRREDIVIVHNDSRRIALLSDDAKWQKPYDAYRSLHLDQKRELLEQYCLKRAAGEEPSPSPSASSSSSS